MCRVLWRLRERFLICRLGLVGVFILRRNVPVELQAALYTADAKEGNEDSETFCIGPLRVTFFGGGKELVLIYAVGHVSSALEHYGRTRV